jgi:O-antigen/teichoic acid export membrane protein
MDNRLNVNSNNVLTEIADGSVFILLGTIVAVALDYGIQILVARSLGPSGYGLINLGFSILLIITTLSLVGYHIGVTRYISYYIAKKEVAKIREVISSGLKFILPMSFIFSTLFFISRSFIANNVFKKPELQEIITIFSITIPFAAIAEFFYACLRGFKKAKFSVLSREISRRAITISILSAGIILGYGLKFAAWAYSLGFIGFALIAYYYLNFKTIRISNVSKKPYKVGKELFFYSWPLIFSFAIIQINSKTGIILIGYFRSAEEVGFYNAALPLSQITSAFLTIVLFMFMPVMSELYSQSRYEEIKSVFKDVTRWIFLPSCIVFLILFIFPEPVLSFIFGNNFIQAKEPLRILCIAFFINALFGPVGALLLAIGQTKKYFISDVIGFSVSIVLSLFLIPRFGSDGAAYAVLVSMGIVNFVRLCFVNWYIKANPFRLNYLKFAIPAIIWSCLLYFWLDAYLSAKPLLIIPIILLLLMLCFSSFIILKGLEYQDLEMISVIESKIGRKLPLLRRLIALGV